MTATKIAERRRNPRGNPSQLVYIEFGTDNGGMIKNVAEGGMRFFLMNPVIAGHKLHFGMTIDSSRRIEGEVSIIWTDGSGKSGGLSFASLSPKSQQTLRGWLAEIDGLSRTQEFSPAATTPSLPNGDKNPSSGLASPPLAEKPSPPAAGIPEPPVVIAPPAISAPRPAAPAAAVIPASSASPPAASVAEKLLPTANLPTLTYDTPRLATREEWRRAMREDSAPAEKPAPETSPEKMIAAVMPPPVPAAAPAAAPAPSAVAAPPQSRPESRAAASDPLPHLPSPSFLPTPTSARIEAQPFVKPRPERELSLDQSLSQPNFAVPLATGVSRSRLAMILALAAICGAAAAFAGIAYRRNVGESLIAIGEKISGDSHSTVATSVDPQNPPPPTDSSAAAAPSTTPQEPVAPQQPQHKPLDATQPSDSVTHDSPHDTAARPKAPPQDISSLWVAVQNGDAAAELVLANRYIAGDGVTKNCDQARVLLEAAAKRGNAAAAKRLAGLPSTGCQ